MSLCMRGRYEVHALSNAGARGEAVKPNQELSVLSNATVVSSGQWKSHAFLAYCHAVPQCMLSVSDKCSKSTCFCNEPRC